MKKTEKDWKPDTLFLSNESVTEKAVSDAAISQNHFYFEKNDDFMPQNDSLIKKTTSIMPEFDSVKAFQKLDEKIKKLK